MIDYVSTPFDETLVPIINQGVVDFFFESTPEVEPEIKPKYQLSQINDALEYERIINRDYGDISPKQLFNTLEY
jgi:hypothetical protein